MTYKEKSYKNLRTLPPPPPIGHLWDWMGPQSSFYPQIDQQLGSPKSNCNNGTDEKTRLLTNVQNTLFLNTWSCFEAK